MEEYWGTYNNYKIYKYYDRDIKSYSKKNKDYVIAWLLDNNKWQLWKNGYIIGEADGVGNIKSFDVEKPEREERRKNSVTTTTTTVPISGNEVDKVLENAMKRSLEELIGVKFSN